MSRYRVDGDAKYRRSYFAEGQTGKGSTCTPAVKTDCLSRYGGRKPFNTKHIASFFRFTRMPAQ
jgi:hypothetical protein